MSCNNENSNYNSDIEYEKHMVKSYHSYPWNENLRTRTQYDLDMKKMFSTDIDRNNQKPIDEFSNVMMKENYEPCGGFRTQFDMDMQTDFDTISDRSNSINSFGNVMAEQYKGPNRMQQMMHHRNKQQLKHN
jgi:hypothetical protein